MIRKSSVFIFAPMLMFLATAPINMGLSFSFGYLILMFALRGYSRKKKYIYASISFAVFWTMTMHWLALIDVGFFFYQRMLIFAGMLLLTAVTGFIWGLPFLALDTESKEVYLIPILHAAIEFVLSIENNTAFLWFTPGHSLLRLLPLAQIADLGGSYILTVFALMLSILVYRIFTVNKKHSIINMLIFMLMIVSTLIYGFAHLNAPVQGTVKSVTIIQPDVPGFMKDNQGELYEQRRRFIKALLKESEQYKQDIIIFPETASPDYLQRHTVLRGFLEDYVKRNNTDILIGSLRLSYVRNKKAYEYFNSVYLFSSDTLQTYDKIRPLGFVERVPFDDRFNFLRNIPFGQGDFSPGRHFTVFNSQAGKFGTYICFEAIFPSMAAKFVRNGAQFLVNMSEDIWFFGSQGPYQHWQMSIMRAIENRRYLVRVSNPGISGIIDPCGRVVEQIDIYDTDVRNADIVLQDKLTFYTRFDNILPKLFTLIMIFYFIIRLIRRLYDRCKSKNCS